MVSHKYKCIFVEVPKTGSTSVRMILGRPLRPHLGLWETRRLMESYWTQRGGRSERLRESLYLLRSKARRQRIGEQQFQDYFKFGFVRNPWDRVVSLYERTEARQMRETTSFEEFVRGIRFSSSTCVHSSPHRYQLDWFLGPSGEMLADFIGKFENLADDWALIVKRLGAEGTLPHTRKNPRSRHYTEYYSRQTKEIIARRFDVDIEHFGYEFGI